MTGRPIRLLAATLSAVALWLTATPAGAMESTTGDTPAQQAPAAPATVSPTTCAAPPCSIRMTAAQLLATTERLVRDGQYDAAAPLLTALRMAPGFTLQTRFLTGYVAAQRGDYATAAREFKAILADDPSQTRVRLELGRAMIALGQTGAADRQLRLAQQSRELDPDLARLVRGARDVIRSARRFSADLSLGIAPDSNINNATSARVVDVRLGGFVLPLALDPGARARSGIGATATGALSTRLPIGKDTFFLANVDAGMLQYAGTQYDDYNVQVAAGGEVQVSDTTSLSVQPVAAQRWYGGRVASRQVGIRGGMQRTLDQGRRIGVQVDVRRTDTDFDAAFDGTQSGLYASYETGLKRTFVAAAQAFVRRDSLHAAAYSNVEVGAAANVAGELPHGFNLAFGGSASRAWFDAAIPIFSDQPRRDWRVTSQVSLGYRKLRVWGFSPRVSWQATGILSSLDIYRTTRSRFSFSLARYF